MLNVCGARWLRLMPRILIAINCAIVLSSCATSDLLSSSDVPACPGSVILAAIEADQQCMSDRAVSDLWRLCAKLEVLRGN